MLETNTRRKARYARTVILAYCKSACMHLANQVRALHRVHARTGRGFCLLAMRRWHLRQRER